MKAKQSFEDYVTRNELESTYNYQKKVFDSKIEEINQIVDKIQECFSLRFGEDLGNSRYDKEIEEIKNSLRQVKIDSNNEVREIEKRLENAIDGKISELEFKNQKVIEENIDKTKDIVKDDIEDFYKDVNKRIIQEENILKEFKNIKMKELSSSIEYIEQRAREIKESTEEYARIFREEIKDIGKDGRSRTAIAKQEKTIKEIRENKEEIENLINSNVEELYKSIERLQASLKIDVDSKIEKLNYENTIKNLRDSITNIEELVIENNRENSSTIKDLIEDFNSSVETKINELENNSKLEDLKENLNNLENQIKADNQNNKTEIENIEKKLENKLDIETYNNNIEEKINNIQSELQNIDELNKSKINNIEQKFEEEKTNNNENISNLEKRLTDNLQNELERLDYKNTINNLKNSLIDIKVQSEKEIQKNKENLEGIQYFFENEIKEKIEDLNYKDTIDKIEYLENAIKEMKETNEAVERKNSEMESQIQAVLSIVVQLEDKFNKGGFETLSNDVGKILDRQIKTIQTKYEKLFESKLKAFEKNLKSQEKIMQNKIEIEKKSTELEEKKPAKRGRPRKEETNPVTQKYNNIVTIRGLDEDYNDDKTSNIYKEISPVQIKEAAASNMTLDEKQAYLQDVINRLKYKNDGNNNQVRKTTPGKSQFLINFNNDEE